jgi:hypothetical protein
MCMRKEDVVKNNKFENSINVTPEQISGMLKILDLNLSDDIVFSSDDIPEFTLEFSGRSHGKVLGYYDHSRNHIVIHDKKINLSDEKIINTAIHEFAHHIHYSMFPNKPDSVASSHNTIFHAINQALLRDAESKGVFRPVWKYGSAETVSSFNNISEKIQNKMNEMAKISSELGELFKELHELCVDVRTDVDTFSDIQLGLPWGEAKFLTKIGNCYNESNKDIGFIRLSHLSKVKAEKISYVIDLYNNHLTRKEIMFRLSEKLQSECVMKRIDFLHDKYESKQLRKEKLEGQLLLIDDEITQIEESAETGLSIKSKSSLKLVSSRDG